MWFNIHVAACVNAGIDFPFASKGDDIIGQIETIIIQNGQEVSDIDEKYEVGYFELQEANPRVDLDHLWPGTKLIIPNRYILPNAPRNGIVINLSELRLYYYPQNDPVVMTYPVGIGKEGEDTPLMSTKIVEKLKIPHGIQRTIQSPKRQKRHRYSKNSCVWS